MLKCKERGNKLHGSDFHFIMDLGPFVLKAVSYFRRD